jgi:hypothetical protein
LFKTGACQRCDAFRVRNRIFEVLRLGTPMVSGNQSTVSEKDKSASFNRLSVDGRGMRRGGH